jgi:hypothetical protein
METPDEIALWMFEQVESGDFYEVDAVVEIERRFGTQFIHTRQDGDPAIDRRVLEVFHHLHGGRVKWDQRNRCWLMRGS